MDLDPLTDINTHYGIFTELRTDFRPCFVPPVNISNDLTVDKYQTILIARADLFLLSCNLNMLKFISIFIILVLLIGGFLFLQNQKIALAGDTASSTPEIILEEKEVILIPIYSEQAVIKFIQYENKLRQLNIQVSQYAKKIDNNWTATSRCPILNDK